jgi:hypothetical protein
VGVWRSHMPAAISALGTAPVASTTLEARADDAAFLLQRYLEARLLETSASVPGGLQQQGIELPAWQHGQRAGHIDAPAARPDASHMGHRLRTAHDFVQQAQAGQRLVRVRDQPVAAGLVAARRVLVDQQDIDTGAGQHAGAGAAGGACADDKNFNKHSR